MKIKGTLESSSKQGCLLNQVALSSPQMIWYTINSARVPGCLGNKCEVTIPAPSKFAAEQMEKTLFLHYSLVGSVSLLPESQALMPTELL